MTFKRTTGEYVTVSTADETCRAFVPYPLPPDPPLRLSLEDLSLVEQANQALGHLIRLGIVRELTGRERHRVYCYDEFVRLLNEDPRLQ